MQQGDTAVAQGGKKCRISGPRRALRETTPVLEWYEDTITRAVGRDGQEIIWHNNCCGSRRVGDRANWCLRSKWRKAEDVTAV